MKSFKPIFILLIASSITFYSCGQNEGDSKEVPKEEIIQKELPAGISVSDVWIRPGGEGMNTGAFCIITNNSETPDTLIGASSDLAELIEVHETYEAESGQMGMRHVPAIPVEANGTLQLKPGSYHVMFIQLLKDVTVGTEHSFTLNFKNGGAVELTGIVEDMPGMGMKKHGKMKE